MGKSDLARLERESHNAKKRYPKTLYLGIAAGAKDNWEFLKQHTDEQILDFWHVTEYLAGVALDILKIKSNESYS